MSQFARNQNAKFALASVFRETDCCVIFLFLSIFFPYRQDVCSVQWTPLIRVPDRCALNNRRSYILSNRVASALSFFFFLSVRSVLMSGVHRIY